MGERVFYTDESEHGKAAHFFNHPFQDKIFVFGGYSVPRDKVLSLKERIDKEKSRFDIPPELPIKWNLRDNSLKKVYEFYNKQDLYREVLKKSDDIRLSILSVLNDLNFEVVGLVSSSYKHTLMRNHRNFYVDCVMNYIQRLGLGLQYKEFEDAIIILDSPPDEREHETCQVFTTAYYRDEDEFGNKIWGGPLKNITYFQHYCRVRTCILRSCN